ncbi:Fic family protein [Actinobaculum sp. 313]|nr:Fic family protein [Actinobaculum sp. 313]
MSTNPHLRRETRIQTIHSSLLIEGNSLSHQDVTAIINGERVLGPPSDIREVENANRAYTHMSSFDPYSPADLLQAHAILMDGLIPDAGQFRAGNAGVFKDGKLIHPGTPAKYVPDTIRNLFSWLSSTDLHPLLASCLFHYEFESIHPFTDGNGRTGRLWHTLLLSHWRAPLAWLPVETVIHARQEEYYRTIATSNQAGSCESFVVFALEAIRDALLPYIEPHPLQNRRQRILGLLRDDPHLTVRALAVQLGCSQRTAERLIAELRAAGQLSREGSARSGWWRVRRPDG